MDQNLDETTSQTTTASYTKPKATVLVPLYIYPLDDETWKPCTKRMFGLTLTPHWSRNVDLDLHSHIIKPSNCLLTLIKNRISGHPNLNFLVIVNPNSGPGDIFVANRDYSGRYPS